MVVLDIHLHIYSNWKIHYAEIVLSTMDKLYTNVPQELLHLLQLNRTFPLYSGGDFHDVPIANRSMGAIIELQHTYYHNMRHENNTK